MSTHIHNTNEACCSIPPVQSNYQPKGTYKSFGDFKKVYITGPAISDIAVVCIFDIFGFYPQTQQGADSVASTLNATVYMPDFFEPEGPFPLDKFPPSSAKDKAALQAFFGGIASPPANVKKVVALGKALKDNGIKHLGLYGLCWGSKVAILSGGESSPYDAVAMIHPAMLSADDASKLTVPLAMYISGDEPVEKYEQIVDIVSKKPFANKSDAKNYSNMFHGWAAARGNLENEENKKEFEDVYSRLIKFYRGALV